MGYDCSITKLHKDIYYAFVQSDYETLHLFITEVDKAIKTDNYTELKVNNVDISYELLKSEYQSSMYENTIAQDIFFACSEGRAVAQAFFSSYIKDERIEGIKITAEMITEIFANTLLNQLSAPKNVSVSYGVVADTHVDDESTLKLIPIDGVEYDVFDDNTNTSHIERYINNSDDELFTFYTPETYDSTICIRCAKALADFITSPRAEDYILYFTEGY